MICYNRVVQTVIITLRTKELFTSVLQAENAPKKKKKKKQKNNSDWDSAGWITCVSSVLMSMHRACLPMQRSTDGRVGGWVLSAHRSSCGSVVPLLFTTQARRACQTRSVETYQGWYCVFCVCVCFILWPVLQCEQRNQRRGVRTQDTYSADLQSAASDCVTLLCFFKIISLHHISSVYIGLISQCWCCTFGLKRPIASLVHTHLHCIITPAPDCNCCTGCIYLSVFISPYSYCI